MVILKGIIVRSNTVLNDMCGKDMVGQSPIDFIHPEHHGKVINRIATFGSKNSPSPVTTYNAVHADGHLFSVKVKSKIIHYRGQRAILTMVSKVSTGRQADKSYQEINN